MNPCQRWIFPISLEIPKHSIADILEVVEFEVSLRRSFFKSYSHSDRIQAFSIIFFV